MVMPRQHLQEVASGRNPMILSDAKIDLEKQIQVASVDLTLGGVAYGMKAAGLPQAKSAAFPDGESGMEFIERFKDIRFTLSANIEENVLYRGSCYVVPLRERLALGKNICAVFSPKSSTGRTDVFVRVFGDKYPHYDRLPWGYKGPLYLEITPLSFKVNIAEGLSLVQMRLKSRRSEVCHNDEIERLHAKNSGILFGPTGKPIEHHELRVANNSLYLHVDLNREIVGFEAKSSPLSMLDLTKVNAYNPNDFWVPVRAYNRQLVLTPGKFYLLATRERVRIPPECCGELMPYEASSIEARIHYAGFFDNGFGGEHGTTAVLEVRGHEVPFRLVDGQPICRMVFEKTFEPPSKLYGEGLGHYTGSGPSISKHFRDRYSIWGD